MQPLQAREEIHGIKFSHNIIFSHGARALVLGAKMRRELFTEHSPSSLFCLVCGIPAKSDVNAMRSTWSIQTNTIKSANRSNNTHVPNVYLFGGLADGKIHVEEILKSYESTTAFHMGRHHVNAMRGFLVGESNLRIC